MPAGEKFDWTELYLRLVKKADQENGDGDALESVQQQSNAYKATQRAEELRVREQDDDYGL